jgi:hypothetical protein
LGSNFFSDMRDRAPRGGAGAANSEHSFGCRKAPRINDSGVRKDRGPVSGDLRERFSGEARCCFCGATRLPGLSAPAPTSAEPPTR